MSETEFLHSSHRLIHLLYSRHKQSLDRTNYLFGILASVNANFSMAHPTPPLSASDFMLGRKAAPEPTDDEIAEDFAAKFALIAVRPGVPIQ